jgi:malate dehydrogenase (oxaloacetate-decarboxylating)(NADP+)
MHGDAALSEEVRRVVLELAPEGRGEPAGDDGCREHLVQPAEDRRRRRITVGPILLGAAKPVHILTPSATVRRIVNMTALAVVDALQLSR